MLKIERVLPQEVLTLQQVVEETYLPYFRYLWEDEGQNYLLNINNLSILEQQLARPQNHYFFARLGNGDIAGYLKLIFSAPVPDTPLQNAICLDKIYLTEAARGQGVGKLLMEFTEQQAQEAQADYLWLRVMDSNPYNLAFYVKHGYRFLYKRWLDLAYIKAEYRGIFTMLKSCLPEPAQLPKNHPGEQIQEGPNIF
jgi:GNAT superfamily N-acetyltransferase